MGSAPCALLIAGSALASSNSGGDLIPGSGRGSKPGGERRPVPESFFGTTLGVGLESYPGGGVCVSALYPGFGSNPGGDLVLTAGSGRASGRWKTDLAPSASLTAFDQ